MTIPEWIDRSEYPFIPKTVAVSPGTMSYLDEGAGDPMVMKHGNPHWSFEYRTLIRRFSESYRCIAPDHIGFGFSDKPTDREYPPGQHAGNLELLLDSLGLR